MHKIYILIYFWQANAELMQIVDFFATSKRYMFMFIFMFIYLWLAKAELMKIVDFLRTPRKYT